MVDPRRLRAAVNLLFRIVDLALEADRRHVVLKLRAELARERVERAALRAEQARLALEEYEDGLRVVAQARRDCL